MKNLESFFKNTVQTLEQLTISANQQWQPMSAGLQQQQQTMSCYNPPNASSAYHFNNASYSRLAIPDSNGHLQYPPYNDQGDRLLDFSGAGYNEGQEPPVNVPVVAYLDPVGQQDDSSRIQYALDNLASKPVQHDGFRGALQLNRGTYHLYQPLTLNASGIVLQGDPAGGTVLIGYENNHLINITGKPNTMDKKRVRIQGDVPVGSREIRVEKNKHHFRVGDTIVVGIHFNEEWIKAIGMDHIPPKGDLSKNNGWKPGRFEHLRRIVHINDDVLWLNEPITTRLEQVYGGGYVQTYTNARVERVGIQYLECVFPANRGRGPDEIMKAEQGKVKDYRFAAEMFDHILVLMNHAENCWVRQVKSVWWRNFAQLGTNTLAITFQACEHTFPENVGKSPLPLVGQFAFEISGQLILIEQCHVEYSFHAYSFKGRIPGPNVVYQSDCVGKNGDVGPHMKWSSGQLYDSLMQVLDTDGRVPI
ncbi:hypothetical protein DFQ28_001974 [Apophysomyces sp. BC1034]|nr:hypothetical protein DFQ29_001493 [Apophysomyces sp. BC1021]KAG0190501.1 hypothetical protein DFQ28_001974 [Apophysomyces sp. BC1034]